MTEVITITNPSYAAYLQTTTGKIIAEQAQQIAALTARVADLEAELENSPKWAIEDRVQIVKLTDALEELLRVHTGSKLNDEGPSYRAAIKSRAVLARYRQPDADGEKHSISTKETT